MAKFKAARIFSDNMVLQFMKPLNIFGTGVEGTEITVEITGEESAKTTV